MKAFQKFWFLLIVISLSSCSGKSKTFMLVLLPDTQCYTDRYPEIFRSQRSFHKYSRFHYLGENMVTLSAAIQNNPRSGIRFQSC